MAVATLFPAYGSTNWDLQFKDYLDQIALVTDAPRDGSDAQPAIMAAIEAAPDGGAVLIPPGSYFLDKPITNTLANGVNKSVHVLAHGATFLKSAATSPNDNTVEFRSGFEQVYNVTALVTATITAPSGSTNGVSLTLNGSPAWKPGDVVKIVADDVIPDSLGGSTDGSGSASRVGQFMTVWSVSGTTVILGGTLFDTYTTNIRCARLQPVECSWQGGRFDTQGSSGRTFLCESAYRPLIAGIDVARIQGAGVALNGSYAPVVGDPYFGWGKNDTTTAAWGYGISGQSSQDIRVSGIRAAMVRHAFDAGGQQKIPANTADLSKYGRAYLGTVSDSIVDSPTSSGYSTHYGAALIKFENCVARNAATGFGLRGIYHEVNDCTVTDSLLAVDQFNNEADEVDGLSYGHTIDGLVTDRVQALLRSSIGSTSGHYDYGVRRSDVTTMRNVTARRMAVGSSTMRPFNLQNGTYELENIHVEYTDTAWANQIVNAKVTGKDLTFDFSKVTSGGPATRLFTLDTSTNSDVEIDGLQILGNSTRLGQVFSNNATQLIRVRNAHLDSPPSNGKIADDRTVTGYIDWDGRSGAAANSGFIAYTSGTVGNELAATRRDAAVTTFTVTADTILTTLPAPSRLGQIVTIINTSAANSITVPHGAAFRTNLTGGANVTLTPGQSMQLAAITAVLWQQI